MCWDKAMESAMKLRRHVSHLAAVALILSAIAGIFLVDAGATQTPAADAVPIIVTIRLEDTRFEPATLKIPANQDVIVRVENTGAALHDFVVPELDFAVEVAPGESTEVTINASAGRYSIICSVSGHKEAGMVGTLLVIAGPAVDPAASPGPVTVENATALPASPAAVLDDPAGLSAHDLLPELQDLDGQWTVEQEGERSDTEFAEAVGPDGKELLLAWGWQESVYRDFAREDPELFSYEATFVNVSIHGFADDEGAAAALQALSQIVVDVQLLKEISVDDLGYNARVLSGPGDDVNITVVYVQAGNFLIRVGASSEAGDPTEMAIDVAEVSLGKAESAPQSTPEATGSPVASPAAVLDDPGCEGFAAYSEQVLSIETATWNRLTTELGIEERFDIFLLDLEDYALLSAILDEGVDALLQVKPPEFVREWHETQIASRQMTGILGRLAPGVGSAFAASLLLWESSDILDEQEERAYIGAVDACPAFALFWSELDLIDGDTDPPPDAGPDFSSCDGLEQYATDLARATVQAPANRPELVETFYEVLDDRFEEMLARSPAELIVVAEMFREFHDELSLVIPPDYAAEWHLTFIEQFRILADYLGTAAARGVEAANAEFETQFGVVALLAEGALEKATEGCDVFPEFAELAAS
jgi:nitrite reductase (NO-forming)